MGPEWGGAHDFLHHWERLALRSQAETHRPGVRLVCRFSRVLSPTERARGNRALQLPQRLPHHGTGGLGAILGGP